MDRLEEEVAPHARGVDVALAAFGVGKGSAKMPEEEVRKIEITYPQAFCRAAKAGGARVCGVMTAAGADPEAGMKYAKIIGEKEKATLRLGGRYCGTMDSRDEPQPFRLGRLHRVVRRGNAERSSSRKFYQPTPGGRPCFPKRRA